MAAKHFFVIGAQRSATTYLYHALDAHPQIEMAQPMWPEPKFFMQEGAEERLAEYESTYFGRKPDALMRGEKTTSYYESQAAARRIATAYQDALIILNMRDPIMRAISNYWFTKSKGLEDREIDVLADEDAQRRQFTKTSVSPFAYLDRGRYVDYIDLYTRHFPMERIKLIVQEDLVQNIECVGELFDWLGVDPGFVPPMLDQTINSADYGSRAVPEHVVEFLQTYYEGPNRMLQERYGVCVSKWSVPARG